MDTVQVLIILESPNFDHTSGKYRFGPFLGSTTVLIVTFTSPGLYRPHEQCLLTEVAGWWPLSFFERSTMRLIRLAFVRRHYV